MRGLKTNTTLEPFAPAAQRHQYRRDDHRHCGDLPAPVGKHTNKHVIPFHLKILTASSWSGLTWLYPSLAAAKEKRFVRIGHVTCKSRDTLQSLQSDWLCQDFGREHNFLWRPSLPVFFRRSSHPQMRPTPIIVPLLVWPARL